MKSKVPLKFSEALLIYWLSISMDDMAPVKGLFPCTILMDESKVVADGLTTGILEIKINLAHFGHIPCRMAGADGIGVASRTEIVTLALCNRIVL